MKLDILAIAAHPDDVELCSSGTLIKHVQLGYKVGIVDLTQGELGTRGNAQLRLKEAEAAGVKMGVAVRKNLGLPDGFFDLGLENKRRIVECIRKYQPRIVLTNAMTDRHPDHGRASQLVSESCFLSGLVKFQTVSDGKTQDRWRPEVVYHFIQDRYIKPDFCVDITPFVEQKREAIMCFKSQFYNPGSDEPDSPISGKDFLDFVFARSRDFGRTIGVDYAEGFNVERPVGARDLFDLH